MPIDPAPSTDLSYGFHAYVNDGNHAGDLDLTLTLKEIDEPLDWTQAEMDAVAQAILDALSSLPGVVSIAGAGRSYTSRAFITATEE